MSASASCMHCLPTQPPALRSLGELEERPEAPVMTLMLSSSRAMLFTSAAPTTRCSAAPPPPGTGICSVTCCARPGAAANLAMSSTALPMVAGGLWDPGRSGACSLNS